MTIQELLQPGPAAKLLFKSTVRSAAKVQTLEVPDDLRGKTHSYGAGLSEGLPHLK